MLPSRIYRFRSTAWFDPYLMVSSQVFLQLLPPLASEIALKSSIFHLIYYQKSLQVSFVVGNVHGSAAEDVRRSYQAREADRSAELLRWLVVLKCINWNVNAWMQDFNSLEKTVSNFSPEAPSTLAAWCPNYPRDARTWTWKAKAQNGQAPKKAVFRSFWIICQLIECLCNHK